METQNRRVCAAAPADIMETWSPAFAAFVKENVPLSEASVATTKFCSRAGLENDFPYLDTS